MKRGWGRPSALRFALISARLGGRQRAKGTPRQRWPLEAGGEPCLCFGCWKPKSSEHGYVVVWASTLGATQHPDFGEHPSQSPVAPAPVPAALCCPLSPLPQKFPPLPPDDISECALAGFTHSCWQQIRSREKVKQEPSMPGANCHSPVRSRRSTGSGGFFPGREQTPPRSPRPVSVCQGLCIALLLPPRSSAASWASSTVGAPWAVPSWGPRCPPHSWKRIWGR